MLYLPDLDIFHLILIKLLKIYILQLSDIRQITLHEQIKLWLRTLRQKNKYYTFNTELKVDIKGKNKIIFIQFFFTYEDHMIKYHLLKIIFNAKVKNMI